MTREEAIAIWDAPPLRMESSGIIDIFVKLGMLKLDEPKTPYSEFFEEMKKLFGKDAKIIILDALQEHGMMIKEVGQ